MVGLHLFFFSQRSLICLFVIASALLSGLHSVFFAYASIIGNHSLHLFIVLGLYLVIYLRVSCVAKLTFKKDFNLYNFNNSYFIRLNQKPLCGLFWMDFICFIGILLKLLYHALGILSSFTF